MSLISRCGSNHYKTPMKELVQAKDQKLKPNQSDFRFSSTFILNYNEIPYFLE